MTKCAVPPRNIGCTARLSSVLHKSAVGLALSSNDEPRLELATKSSPTWMRL